MELTTKDKAIIRCRLDKILKYSCDNSMNLNKNQSTSETSNFPSNT